MRVKVGECATAQITVDVSYHCSSCGTENLSTSTITSNAHTATVLGANLDSDVQGSAMENAFQIIDDLSDVRKPWRFREAGLSCSCKNCGHKEPWARMHFDQFDKASKLCKVVLCMFAVIALACLSADRYNVAHYIIFSIVLLSAAALFGISLYKNRAMVALECLITDLPPESLPKILPHSKDRQNAFHKNAPGHTGQGVVYDTWECKKCGTHNSMKYSQCKKCGEYKKL